jgi:chromatin remodeling complex protein RSC6
MAKAVKKTTTKEAKAPAKATSTAKAPAKAASKTAAKGAAKAAPKKEAAAKKSAPAKTASKSTAKKASAKKGGAANAAFMAPLTPSPALAEVVGSKPLPRTEIVKKVWEYIKKKDLQDPKNKRMINADENLKPIFGKDQISMFELAKAINGQVK